MCCLCSSKAALYTEGVGKCWHAENDLVLLHCQWNIVDNVKVTQGCVLSSLNANNPVHPSLVFTVSEEVVI